MRPISGIDRSTSPVLMIIRKPFTGLGVYLILFLRGNATSRFRRLCFLGRIDLNRGRHRGSVCQQSNLRWSKLRYQECIPFSPSHGCFVIWGYFTAGSFTTPYPDRSTETIVAGHVFESSTWTGDGCRRIIDNPNSGTDAVLWVLSGGLVFGKAHKPGPPNRGADPLTFEY